MVKSSLSLQQPSLEAASRHCRCKQNVVHAIYDDHPTWPANRATDRNSYSERKSPLRLRHLTVPSFPY